MSRDRDNLLRGQGLLKQTISGFAARWKAYGALTVGLTVLGGTWLPVRTLPPIAIECAYHHGKGRFTEWIASGQHDPNLGVTLDGQIGSLPASALANDAYWVRCWNAVKVKAIIGSLLGGMLGFGLCFGLAVWMRERGRKAALDRIIAGTQLVTERQLRRLTKRATKDWSLHIATVGIPAWLECRHFAILGTTGSGKTTAMRQMLDRVEARGEAALVYDTSGEFVSHYYRPERGDVILNPFDARSAYWSPFSELSHPADADRIARQLVTNTGDRDDDVWLETSRILVANILRKLNAEGKTSLDDLLDALQAKTKFLSFPTTTCSKRQHQTILAGNSVD
jgi:type IV secretory pathway TraG/TraD family ATPase VirD4